MKHPKLKLKVNKKKKITEVRKFKQDIKEAVKDCLLDIEGYIVNDIMRLLRKRGIIYAKATKKNKKKKKN